MYYHFNLHFVLNCLRATADVHIMNDAIINNPLYDFHHHYAQLQIALGIAFVT